MNQIYIVRHGQSVANATHHISGTLDSPLSELGRLQAELAGQNAKRFFNIQLIAVSPLTRAQETAHIMAKVMHLSPTAILTIEALRERELGQMEGKNLSDTPEYTASYEIIEQTPGIERINAFYNRAALALRSLQSHSQQQVLAVCHNGIGRMLRTVAEGGRPLNFYSQPRLVNAVIYSLRSERAG